MVGYVAVGTTGDAHPTPGYPLLVEQGVTGDTARTPRAISSVTISHTIVWLAISPRRRAWPSVSDGHAR